MPKSKQTMLPVIPISEQRRNELHNKLKEIYNDIKSRFKDFGKFQDVLTFRASYGSKDLKDNQEPEEFAKQFVIKPLIEFLDYETVSETVLPTPFGMKNPDYKIKPRKVDNPLFYLEAEPFNLDLNSKGHGVSQVNDWLLSKASKTLYGIATDGFIWIILKFEEASSKARPIYTVDLRPVFSSFLQKVQFGKPNETKQIEENFLQFDSQTSHTFLEKKLEFLEEEKEEISRNFYNDYVRYVFGLDKDGKTIEGTCLLKEIISPNTCEVDKSNLFAVIFMNRIIFIKFLEENEIVSKTLLKDLWGRYQESGLPVNFYESFIKPLFYNVFNESKTSRHSRIAMNPMFRDIPYLNGGLFREIIPQESNYNITDDGIELIVNTFFSKYKFGSNQQINADMLGYIFEKTINYISGQGTNKQKEEGAYYTPDDIVGFIIEKTLTPVIFQKMLEGLRNAGWRDVDLKDFDSLETLLSSENRPKNRIAVRKMIESIDTIRVLDPSCGSGHFLTAMLSRLLRVKENLMRSVDEEVDRYKLKKQIITKNIYGVDIDENGVEIARLRLWLSLIEEIQDTKNIEPLPNIDFNIVAGNSLIGWFNEKLVTHPIIDLLEDPTVLTSLDSVYSTHSKEVIEVKKLLQKKTIADTIRAYEKLIFVYSSESGESAIKIREAIAEIRTKLYEVYNNSFINFLHENSDLSKLGISEFTKLAENFKIRKPFHWKVDFGEIFEKKGFDVVVGNPPYIEDGKYDKYDIQIIECKHKSKENKEPLLYHSYSCGNTHAYFIERGIKLTKENGVFGYIVPISLVSTERMDSIRDFIHTNSSVANYFNFDDRPAKIFSGLEHCRSTILITTKGKGLHVINTSKYHRWHTKDRTKFLKTLKTILWTLESNKGIIPKIGTKIEKEIFELLKDKARGKVVKNSLRSEGSTIWFHNAPQYWIHAHSTEFLPKVEYYNSFKKNEQTGEIIPFDLREIKASSQYKPLTLSTEDSKILNGLLNSSLFYWWFVIWSDGRHLLQSQIDYFPFNISECMGEIRDKICSLVDELMKSYDEKSNVKINVRDGGRYCIVIKEIIPKLSKSIIDKIDELFANYLEFSDKQREFISKFDIKFRIEEE